MVARNMRCGHGSKQPDARQSKAGEDVTQVFDDGLTLLRGDEVNFVQNRRAGAKALFFTEYRPGAFVAVVLRAEDIEDEPCGLQQSTGSHPVLRSQAVEVGGVDNDLRAQGSVLVWDEHSLSGEFRRQAT